jgi:hypothetical protein
LVWRERLECNRVTILVALIFFIYIGRVTAHGLSFPTGCSSLMVSAANQMAGFERSRKSEADHGRAPPQTVAHHPGSRLNLSHP